MKRFFLQKFLLLLGAYLGVTVAHASFVEYARGLTQQAQQTARSGNPHLVPGFKTASPPEASLDNPTTLEAARDRVMATNEHAALIKKSAEIRPYFRLDLNTDPLIKNACVPLSNPEAVVSGNDETTSGGKFVTRKCIEAKPPKKFTCIKELLLPVFHVESAKYSHHWCARGNHRPDDPQCTAKKYYNPARMYEPEKIHIQNEVWTSNCKELEEQESRGHVCRLIKQICPKGPETREVKGTMGGQAVSRKITRPCWRYELTYSCTYPSQNTCEGLRQ